MNHYHSDPYAREITATVKFAFEEDDTFFAEVDPVLFHPKGGGQKGDRGTIAVGGETFAVLDARKDENSGNGVILVMDRLVPKALRGLPAVLTLDWDWRLAQMRLHSLVHAHHCMLERVLGGKLAPPKTSDIQDGFAFNRYDDGRVTEQAARQAADELRALVAAGAAITCDDDPARPGMRWWRCAGYDIPCGGVHVRDISEIGPFDLSHSTKKKQQTVTFTLI